MFHRKLRSEGICPRCRFFFFAGRLDSGLNVHKSPTVFFVLAFKSTFNEE